MTIIETLSGAANENSKGAGSDPREFERIATGLGKSAVEVMRFPTGGRSLRPLVIVGSIEFVMPPSVQFCEQMKSSGLQVIFIRRSGFGGAPKLPREILADLYISDGTAATAEAVALFSVLRKMELGEFVLVGLGSSNPVCHRLVLMNRNIRLSIFANHAFNKCEFDIFGPHWFQSLMREMLQTKSGIRMAERSLRRQMQNDPIKFYRNFLKKSAGDLAYASQNESDILQASALQGLMESGSLYYDAVMSLTPDDFLTDGRFEKLNAVVLNGEETTDSWRERVASEAERLGIESVLAASGDVFVAYASPETLVSIIDRRA